MERDDTVWTEYPPELLQQAEQDLQRAEREFEEQGQKECKCTLSDVLRNTRKSWRL